MSTSVVLFDMGGVLIQLGGVDQFGRMVGLHDEEEIWRRWLASPAVRRFERGRCTSDEFASEMVVENDLEISADEFLEIFRNWPKGLLEGALEMVGGLADSLRIACLSNTNTLHWNEQKDAEIVKGLFDVAFLSHEIGMVKPDAEIYQHVIGQLACDPAEILFLDDNTLNVEAAQELGLDAHRIVGVEPALSLLQERGLLSAQSEAMR